MSETILVDQYVSIRTKQLYEYLFKPSFIFLQRQFNGIIYYGLAVWDYNCMLISEMYLVSRYFVLNYDTKVQICNYYSECEGDKVELSWSPVIELEDDLISFSSEDIRAPG